MLERFQKGGIMVLTKKHVRAPVIILWLTKLIDSLGGPSAESEYLNKNDHTPIHRQNKGFTVVS